MSEWQLAKFGVCGGCLVAVPFYVPALGRTMTICLCSASLVSFQVPPPGSEPLGGEVGFSKGSPKG